MLTRELEGRTSERGRAQHHQVNPEELPPRHQREEEGLPRGAAGQELVLSCTPRAREWLFRLRLRHRFVDHGVGGRVEDRDVGDFELVDWVPDRPADVQEEAVRCGHVGPWEGKCWERADSEEFAEHAPVAVLVDA